MTKRKFKIIKATALALAIIMLAEVAIPTIAYSLTSGPTTPEVYGHQPSDATDNVSLLTGDFNYTIPITSIPEYPMAIGYSSQGGMDQDAGIFGYGVSGFSGAIARSLQGLPDDLDGALRKYQYDNQKNWRASVAGTVGFGVGVVGVGASLMVGYDNYKGMFGGLGVSLGVNTKVLGLPVNIGVAADVTSESELVLSGKLGVQVNIINVGGYWSSKYGFSGTAGIQLGALGYQVSGSNFNNLSHEVSYSSDRVSKNLNLQDAFGTYGVTSFSSPTHTAISLLSPLPSLVATTKSFGISVTIPISAVLSVTGTYNSNNYGWH
jgi:hypothetical protein